LLKRFRTDKFLDYFDIQIINDPLSILSKILNVSNQPHCNFQQNIFLPLYGEKNGKYEVFPRSGLNQWNARGRTRDCNEAYIRVPQIIHQKFADFFPSRDTKFDLKLPNGNIISAKICQEGGKALMSDPNKELGKWILRDVLDLKEGELLTYEKLANLNIDSVRIDKISERSYLINFAKIGSYENFIALLPNSP
jgi:hypothetical protein